MFINIFLLFFPSLDDGEFINENKQSQRNHNQLQSGGGGDSKKVDHQPPTKLSKNQEKRMGIKKRNNINSNSHAGGSEKYSHPWLLTTLKGHTGQVLAMDISSNGKYLATCSTGKSPKHNFNIVLVFHFICHSRCHAQSILIHILLICKI